MSTLISTTCHQGLFSLRPQTKFGAKDLDLRLSAADEKTLRQVILADLPELTEVAGRIVSKDLESVLEESSCVFAVQRAEATWKKKSEKDKVLDASFKSQEV